MYFALLEHLAYTGNEVVSPTDIKDFNGATIAAGTPFRGVIEDFGAGNVALTEPWFVSGLGGGFVGPSEQNIQDATNARLRELSLSYSLNSAGFREKTKLGSIDFSFSARNLFIWTKEYEGNDPETNLTGSSNAFGLDYFNNPGTKSFVFSVGITY